MTTEREREARELLARECERSGYAPSGIREGDRAVVLCDAAIRAIIAALTRAQEAQGAVGEMTPKRASFFLERFLREEKMLGPNEQWALRYAMQCLATPPAPVPAEAQGAVAVVTIAGYPQWLVSWLESDSYRYLPEGTLLYTTPPAPVDVRRLSELAESWRKEANGWLLQTDPAELLRDCADSLLALLSAQPSADAGDGER